MLIQEKLHVLMQFLDVSNSKLAKTLMVDPSLISRWRSGERQLMPDSLYIENIVQCLVHHIKTTEQVEHVLRLMDHEDLATNADATNLKAVLHEWFCHETPSTNQWIDDFLKHLSLPKPPETPLEAFVPYEPLVEGSQEGVRIYRGKDGKRASVIAFLRAVLASKTPVTLMLFSDESIDWMIEDTRFLKTWGSYLFSILQSGHRIKIVHTVKRDLREMLEGIKQWMPLYLTGQIEPYYDPKYKETQFKRTHFIAPGIAAIISSGLKGCDELAENVYLAHQESVLHQERMFKHYLSHCRPLMQIFTLKAVPEYHKLQCEFIEAPDDMMTLSTGLSSWYLPNETLKRMLAPLAMAEDTITHWIALHEKKRETMLNYLKEHRLKDIIYLPESIGACNELLPCDSFLPRNTPYDLEALQAHLGALLTLLQTIPNYSVELTTSPIKKRLFLSTKNKAGVFLVQSEIHPIAFAFNHQNMSDAFVTYMSGYLSQTPCTPDALKLAFKKRFQSI